MKDKIEIYSKEENVKKIINDISKINKIYQHPIIGKAYLNRILYVLKKINLKNKVVLDLGFGYGIMLPLLKIRESKVYGIEPNKEHFFNTKKILIKNNLYDDIKIYNESAENMNFEDEKFDIIITISVLEHILEPTKFYKEVSRVLNKEGIFIVMVPTENRIYDLFRLILRIKKPGDHYYNSKEIKKKLSNHFIIKREYNYYRFLPFFKLFICKKV